MCGRTADPQCSARTNSYVEGSAFGCVGEIKLMPEGRGAARRRRWRDWRQRRRRKEKVNPSIDRSIQRRPAQSHRQTDRQTGQRASEAERKKEEGAENGGGENGKNQSHQRERKFHQKVKKQKRSEMTFIPKIHLHNLMLLGKFIRNAILARNEKKVDGFITTAQVTLSIIWWWLIFNNNVANKPFFSRLSKNQP